MVIDRRAPRWPRPSRLPRRGSGPPSAERPHRRLRARDLEVDVEVLGRRLGAVDDLLDERVADDVGDESDLDLLGRGCRRRGLGRGRSSRGRSSRRRGGRCRRRRRRGGGSSGQRWPGLVWPEPESRRLRSRSPAGSRRTAGPAIFGGTCGISSFVWVSGAAVAARRAGDSGRARGFHLLLCSRVAACRTGAGVQTRSTTSRARRARWRRTS